MRYYSFAAAGTDAYTPGTDDDLVYTLLAGPPEMTIHPTTGAITYTPFKPAQPASYNVVVKVEDALGLSSTATRYVSVGLVDDLEEEPGTPTMNLVTVQGYRNALEPAEVSYSWLNNYYEDAWGSIAIRRWGDLSESLTVAYSATGSAGYGTDYLLGQSSEPIIQNNNYELTTNELSASGQLTFAPHQDEIFVTIYPLFDTDSEGLEDAIFSISIASDPTSSYTVDSASNSRIVLRDFENTMVNQTTPLPTLSTQVIQAGKEGESPAILRVTRTDAQGATYFKLAEPPSSSFIDQSGPYPKPADYAVWSGTGQDFVRGADYLYGYSFQDGQTTKDVSFWPLRDAESEPTETIVSYIPYAEVGQYGISFGDPNFSYYPPHHHVTIEDGPSTTPQLGWAPVARDDAFATAMEEVLTGNVLTNDLDYDLPLETSITAHLLAELLTEPDEAATEQFELFPDGSFNFTPKPGWTGQTTFTYRAFDGDWESNVATVSLTSHAAPVANDNPTYTLAGQAITIDVLANDLGKGLSIDHVVTINGGAGQFGTIHIVNNKVVYQPAAGFYGLATYEYQLIDQFGRTDTALLTIGVVEVWLSSYAFSVVGEENGSKIDLYVPPNASTTSQALAAKFADESGGPILREWEQSSPGNVTKDLPAAFVRGSRPEITAAFKARGALPAQITKISLDVLLLGELIDDGASTIIIDRGFLSGSGFIQGFFTLDTLPNYVKKDEFTFDWTAKVTGTALTQSMGTTTTDYYLTLEEQQTPTDLTTLANKARGGLKATPKRLDLLTTLAAGAATPIFVVEAVGNNLIGQFDADNSVAAIAPEQPTLSNPWNLLDKTGGDCQSIVILLWEALDMLGVHHEGIEVRYVYPVSNSWSMDGNDGPWSTNDRSPESPNLRYYRNGRVNIWEATLYIPANALMGEYLLNQWWAGGVGKFEGNDDAEVSFNILMDQIEDNADTSNTLQGFVNAPPPGVNAVPVPGVINVKGITPQAATAALEALGFRVEIDPTPIPGDQAVGMIQSQNPEEGTYPTKNFGGNQPWGPHQPIILKVSSGNN
jgi:hypothetical protein